MFIVLTLKVLLQTKFVELLNGVGEEGLKCLNIDQTTNKVEAILVSPKT